ncbi:MAG: hypothetical protein IT337_12505 [Thermomicrobiales bacterium]|nr:hypothetical protein [Thermomicrobiales bacterium]
MEDFLQFLPGVVFLVWAALDRRPLAFAAAAAASLIGIAATPFLLRRAYPMFALERMNDVEEVIGFVVLAGWPVAVAGVLALGLSRWRDNAPLPAPVVTMLSLWFIVSAFWPPLLSMMWAL